MRLPPRPAWPTLLCCRLEATPFAQWWPLRGSAQPPKSNSSCVSSSARASKVNGWSGSTAVKCRRTGILTEVSAATSAVPSVRSKSTARCGMAGEAFNITPRERPCALLKTSPCLVSHLRRAKGGDQHPPARPQRLASIPPRARARLPPRPACPAMRGPRVPLTRDLIRGRMPSLRFLRCWRGLTQRGSDLAMGGAVNLTPRSIFVQYI